LPLGEKHIGFHVLDSQIEYPAIDTVSNLGDTCHSNGELSEISSEEEILRTENEKYGVHLYIGDNDPDVPGGFDGEENYDAIWVDNGTECLFSPADGPFYKDEFFRWGGASNYGGYYDFKDISDGNQNLILYDANQTVRFRDTMKQEVNGISTDVRFDTFNFSSQDLAIYDTIVFRERDALTEIETDSDKEDRVIEYLQDGSALFLAQLQDYDFDPGKFMHKTGMDWKDLPEDTSPSGASFSDTKVSKDIENRFLGQNGVPGSVSLQHGGKVRSGREVVHSGTYDRSNWDAGGSVTTDSSPPPGIESPCDEYYSADDTFDESGNTYSLHLYQSNCTDDIWLGAIDLDGDDSIEGKEGSYLNGEVTEIDGARYKVSIDGGSSLEFNYEGPEEIEIVNYRTEFRDRNIDQFARADFEDSYSEDDRKLLAAVVYQLSSERNSFGSDDSAPITTTVIGSVDNSVYMPYRLNMRWNR